jgi:hypothetical protein
MIPRSLAGFSGWVETFPSKARPGEFIGWQYSAPLLPISYFTDPPVKNRASTKKKNRISSSAASREGLPTVTEWADMVWMGQMKLAGEKAD